MFQAYVQHFKKCGLHSSERRQNENGRVESTAVPAGRSSKSGLAGDGLAMRDEEREVLGDEYYVQGRPELPGDGDLVGQDLITHRRQRSQNAGDLEDGYSYERTLCIVDPRLFRRPTRMITAEVRRLNEDLGISRSVDLAVFHSEDRNAIEGLLIQVTLAIWEIRTGEIACNDVQDMIQNLTVFA